MAGGDEVDRLRETLSERECARIKRRPDTSSQQRLAVCWGRTREILAGILDCSPAAVPVCRDPTGRPGLDDPATDLRFSLSHSGEWALLAVAEGVDVGIDIERVREDVDVGRMAKRFFTPAETQQLLAREEKSKRDAFFRTWTRKEALIKALGLGVPGALQQVSALLRPDGDLVIDPQRAGWRIEDLPAPAGYAAALAVAAADVSIRVAHDL